MKTSLSRWGDALGIELPAAELARAGLAEGANLDVIVEPTSIIVKKASETEAQFVAALWACQEVGLSQEPLWDDAAQGSEYL
jgi:antitoxin component of MazEF toxin-antitoxin module